MWTTYLGSAVLCSALRRRQLATSLVRALARVAVIDGALAHLVGLAGNCWVDGVRRALGGGVLRHGLCTGLTGTCSEEMLS
jgi:hypothetical protein